MGQELIKSTVDASVFVINLTPALIRFVMTAVLAPPTPPLTTDAQAVEEAASGQQRTFTIIPPSLL